MRMPGWMFFVGVVVLVGATALCSVTSFTVARQLAVDLGDSGVEVPSFSSFISARPTPTVAPTLRPRSTGATAVPASADAAPAFIAPTATVDPLASYTWDDPRRINLLLMGIDQRRGEQGPFRADTLIILSVDPVRKSVGMLSIPRDLWVQIPGFQPNRINTANLLGDGGNYPGGGAALTARTITENLGIPVENYVLVNFDAFTTVVDLVAPSGAEVCPPEEIRDDYYPDGSYGFIQISFPAGCQRLRAEQLLQYARTRHGNSDFDRATRQQEVIQAVRNEVISAGGIANFITQIPALWDELSDSYETNLSLEEILSLGALAQEIPQDNIRTGVIGAGYVELATTAAGDEVLIPRYDQIRLLIQDVFNPSTTPQEALSLAELRERGLAENPTIAVFNNAAIPGLAGQTRDWLASRQVPVSEVGNMPSPDNAPTTIRVYTGKTWAARYLADLLGLPADRIVTMPPDSLTTADLMLVVGSDAQTLIAGQ